MPEPAVPAEPHPLVAEVTGGLPIVRGRPTEDGQFHHRNDGCRDHV